MHHSRTRSRVLLGAAALAIPLLPGCGDDGVERLSEAEFLKQGNAICAESNARMEKKGEETFGALDGPPTAEDIAPFADYLVDEVDQQISGVEALVPPEDLQDEMDEVLPLARAAQTEMESQIEADPVAFMESEENVFADVNAKLADIGLTDCDE